MIHIAEKEMGITAKLNIDEVISGLDGLIDRLSQIPDSEATEIRVDGIEDVETAASEASDKLDEVNSSAESLSYTMTNTLTGETISVIANDADNLTDSLDQAATGASGVDLNLQSVGEAASFASSGISGISEQMENAKQSTDGASESASTLADGFGLVEGAVSALVGVGLAGWIDEIANAAGSFNDSWLRLTLSMDGSTDDVTAMKDKWSGAITEMHDVTGRRAGTIREFITQMGISGVEASDVIIKSFDAIAGSDFILNGGKNIDGVAAAFENVIRQPTRVVGALRTMGITTDDILKTTGLSTQELTEQFKNMSVEQRAVFLANILDAKYGAEANEGYKLSWQHVKDALSASWDYISRIFGSLILPLIVPVLEFLTTLLSNVASAIDDLNPIFKTIGGAVLLFGGALTSIYLILAPLWSLISGPLLTSLGEFTGLITGAGEATGILATALGPVGWAILAIIGIILTAIYVWQNWSKEIIAFKDAILSGDWGSAAKMIVSSFDYVGQAIYNALIYAGQQIWTYFMNLPTMIGQNATGWLEAGRNFLRWLVEGLTSLTDYLSTVVSAMLQSMATDGTLTGAGTVAGQSAGQGLIGGLVQWLIDNAQLIYDVTVLIFEQLAPLIVQLIAEIGIILALALIELATQAIQAFISGLMQYLPQVPVLFATMLANVSGQILLWIASLTPMGLLAGSNLVQSFISRVSQLPGQLWIYLSSALSALGSFAGSTYSYMASAGSRMVSGLSASISGLPGIVRSEISRIVSVLASAGSSFYSWAYNLGTNIVNGIKKGMGIASPGFMYWMIVDELGLMEDALKDNMLTSLATDLGSNISNAFLPSLAGVTLQESSTNTIIKETGQALTFTIDVKKGAVVINGNATTETIESAGESLGSSIVKGALSNGYKFTLG